MGLASFIRQLWNTPPRHSPTHVIRRYDGAKRGRNYGNWFVSQNSANADIWADLTTLRGRSRDVIRNNDYARGVIGKLVDNVVYLGITFQSQVKQLKVKDKNDDRINNLIESAFKDWAEEKLWCHTAGKLNFAGIQQLALRSCLESGEVFVRKVKQSFSGSPVPFALEIIEADQLAEEHNCIHGTNQVVMGVEVDRWQRPVAYWFYREHPGDLWQGRSGVVSRELQRIPASEIIHLHLCDRPNQARGLPLLFSTLIRLKNTGDYEENELLAAKLASCVMAMITTPYSDLLGEPGGENSSELPADEKFEPGVMRYLAPGESTEAQSSQLTPGVCQAQFVIFSGSSGRKSLGIAKIQVLVGFENLTELDPRSDDEKELEAITTAIARLATGAVAEYRIGDRMMRYQDLAELTRRQEYLRRRIAIANKHGGIGGRNVGVRFSS